jgi:hypothetical protein
MAAPYRARIDAPTLIALASVLIALVALIVSGYIGLRQYQLGKAQTDLAARQLTLEEARAERDLTARLVILGHGGWSNGASGLELIMRIANDGGAHARGLTVEVRHGGSAVASTPGVEVRANGQATSTLRVPAAAVESAGGADAFVAAAEVVALDRGNVVARWSQGSPRIEASGA